MDEEDMRRVFKERRKRQKQRRKERKKEEAKAARIADRTRRLEKAVERRIQEMEQETRGVAVSRKRPGTSQQGERVPQKTSREAALKEIKTYHVTKSKHLGTGSYGSCYLGSYRGMNVVIKELKVRVGGGETHEDAEKRVREEMRYEARIVRKLGDHPGLPLLFGVCSQRPPFRMVMQFHGEKDCSSFTILSALRKKVILETAVWLDIIKNVTEAIAHVHSAGFLHNDIKSNNVVLDNTSRRCQPVLIDFGKSLPVSGLKGPKIMSPERQIKYSKDYPHIAPEIVTGKQGQSFASDVFSLAYMGKVIFEKAKLGPLPEVLLRATCCDPAERPTLKDISESLKL